MPWGGGSSNTTITLIRDVAVAETLTIPADRSITLDLNGHTLTSSADGITVATGAELTITGNGTITATGSSSKAVVNSGKLTIENGTFTGVYAAVRALGGSTTVINGGSFHGGETRQSLFYWANGTALTVIINDGTFNQPVSTATESGKVILTVKGGSFKNDLTAFCGEGYGTILDATTGRYNYGKTPDSYVVDEDGNATLSDEAALLWFAAQVNQYGNTFAGKTVTLAADITLTKTWAPVGISVAKSFKGTFDGAGHTISGMKVYGAYQEYGLGFFKTIVSATVKNVTFDNADVTGVYSNIVGIVAGYSYSSSIFENVHVKNSTVYAFGKVGGIVGYAEDRSATTTFKDCSVEDSTIHAGYNGAGFLGLVQGKCEVTGSYLKGNEIIIDEDAQGFGKVTELDTTVACDGSVATCAGNGTVIKGKYIPDSDNYYFSAYSDLYNHYGDGSHDCTLADGKLLANSEVTHNAAVQVEMDGKEYLFSDLQGAFDFAKKGATVTLLSDITLTEQVNILTALDGLTLDGNGHTITCATATDPLKSGGSALYFGNANEKKYCTGITIKNLTMTGTARFAIFLCGGTSTTFENVKISGKWYFGINLYGTHGATMTNCEIINESTYTEDIESVAAIWSNVASVNPLTLINTKVSSIAINAYTKANTLAPKIFVDAGSAVDEIHTFDDGSVSGDKRLCVSPTSEGTYLLKEYDDANKTWVDIRVAKITDADGNVTYFGTLAEAFAAAKAGQTVKLLSNMANIGNIVISKNLIIDGCGYIISGNSNFSVEMPENAAADLTFINLTFKDIKNGNKLSAFYCARFKGKLTLTGCTFDSIEYEALQITPAPGAVINISDNLFIARADGKQVRLVHVEMAYGTGFDYEGQNISLVFTDNRLLGTVSGDASLGVWWVGADSELTLSGNYIENTDTVSVTLSKGGVRYNGAEKIYPARSQADVDVDNLMPVAIVLDKASGDSKSSTYNSLAEAIAAAKDGQTVKLLADATMDITLNKSITLDLGGFTLTGTGASGTATLTIANGATVTVKNGTILGTANSYYTIQNNGTATFVDLTAVAGNTGSSMLDNYGTLTITSGTYTGGLNTVKNEPAAMLTINGGTFTLTKGTSDGFTGVVFNYGTLEITGGEFIQNDKSAPYGQAQVIHTDKSGSTAPSTVIKGGTFKNLRTHSTAWTVRATNAAAGATKVSGGTFNKSIACYYFADGSVLTKNSDGTYGVKEGQYVARIGTKGYESLAAAIEAAGKGEEIDLMKDVYENVTIAAGQQITLDLNGKTLNGGTGTSVATITNYGTLTIKDSVGGGRVMRDDSGTVGEKSYYVIHNINGTLTIEGGTIYNNSGYEKENPSGSMVGSSLICNGDKDGETVAAYLYIKGGTLIQKNFIAIKNGSNGIIEVTGGEISSDHSAIQNWFKATITGGKINGQLWTDSWEEGSSVGETVIGGDAVFTGEIVIGITGKIVPTLKITGGTLNITKMRITTAAANAGAKPAISGGVFSIEIKDEWCVQGFAPVQNADGTYGVEQLIKIEATEGVLGESIKFYILTNRYGDLKFRIRVTLNGEEVIYEGIEYTKDGKEYYAYILDLPPQYLDTALTIELVNDDDETIETREYSFLEYCEAVLKEDENAKQLIADLLWYSVAAKNKCGLDSASLVTKLGKLGLVQSTGDVKATVEKSHTATGDNKLISGATLYHDSVNRIIILVEKDAYANAENHSFTYRKADGEAKALVNIGELEKDGITYVTLATEGIYANEFDTRYTIEISVDEAVVEKLVYSVNSYCEVKAESNALAKAIYYYGVSAKAYKH